MQPPAEPHLSLEDLEQLSGFSERTIRSYIARGLVPPPRGRGRGSSYGEEHLVRLNFLKAIRDAVPRELPLSVLERLLEDLPEEQIARIARGEEAVVAAALDGLDMSLLRRRRSHSAPREDAAPRLDMAAERAPPRFSLGAPHYSAPRDDEPDPEDRDEVQDEVWSTIDVTPRLRISMRGPAGSTSAELKRLARRVRAWLTGDDSG